MNEPKEHWNIQEAVAAQEEYCKRLAVKNPKDWMAKNFARGEGFAPRNGWCWSCHENIYQEGLQTRYGWRNGISVERAGSELTTGCPFCNRSYVD